MKYFPLMLATLTIALGGVLMYFGEVDDSPGLGGIGLIIIVLSIAWTIRYFRRRR